MPASVVTFANTLGLWQVQPVPWECPFFRQRLGWSAMCARCPAALMLVRGLNDAFPFQWYMSVFIDVCNQIYL